MIAKITSKNQLTLPKSVVQAIGATEYFDVEVRQGQIVLTPVRMQRGDAVRAKLAALGLTEADVPTAVRWSRSRSATPMVAEPPAPYAPAKTAAKRTSKPGKKKSSQRA
jgi:antitoxin component of MazEF toxin-antitoxin module